VPNELNKEVLQRLAKLGALARLEQIDAERKAILAAFPDLAAQRARARGAKRGGTSQAAAAPVAAPKRRRRRMTTAQRREVAERMKRYWAERRKAKGKEKE
jgi:hypothetical protein